MNKKNFRNLTSEEVIQLEKQGCKAQDWQKIKISPELNLRYIENVKFQGFLLIGKDVVLKDIPGGIGNCVINEGAHINNVFCILFEEGSRHGVGTQISVLDETGSRPVTIYPGISSQIATLMARQPGWIKNKLETNFDDFIESKITSPEIGEKAVIINSGPILNVHIGREVIVEGATRLLNGSIINNAGEGKGLAYVGTGVDAENFIIEDGSVKTKAILENCYVGQGVEIAKGFTAHDSLFFANSTLENGESNSVLAGPYSVSVHKSTLLIGIQTSFMNAGSGSNQSNHMYKLGPVHWGVLERGVKTSSGSYLMLGAKIGAFSLLMGSHKTHPDSSMFPFSYLFGDERGATVVVPAAMLRSCGLMRDEIKWPKRDRRLKRKLPLHDLINFNVLNPASVDSMLKAIDTIEELLTKPSDDDLFMRFKGMKFRRAALERATWIYRIAIFKYLSQKLSDNKFPQGKNGQPEEWLDLGGLIITRSCLNKILEAENITDAEALLKEAHDNFDQLELQWIADRFDENWKSQEEQINIYAKKFDDMVEEDKEEYLKMLDEETKMLAL
ncbi:MAG: DUF4954 family protein [Muribaculaceae bacterium]|nr:DUF4954 family protein [Muribaculaceae bacterium]